MSEDPLALTTAAIHETGYAVVDMLVGPGDAEHRPGAARRQMTGRADAPGSRRGRRWEEEASG